MLVVHSLPKPQPEPDLLVPPGRAVCLCVRFRVGLRSRGSASEHRDLDEAHCHQAIAGGRDHIAGDSRSDEYGMRPQSRQAFWRMV